MIKRREGLFQSTVGKHTANVCPQENVYKMWFRCKQFHLKPLEIVGV